MVNLCFLGDNPILIKFGRCAIDTALFQVLQNYQIFGKPYNCFLYCKNLFKNLTNVKKKVVVKINIWCSN